MNWEELEHHWTDMHVLFKTHWKKLTDADLDLIDGRREELATALKRLYGYGEEEAENAICAFEKEVRFSGAVK